MKRLLPLALAVAALPAVAALSACVGKDDRDQAIVRPEVEPNDSKAEATWLGSNGQYVGFYGDCAPGDEDWLEGRAGQNGKLVLTMNAFQTNGTGAFAATTAHEIAVTLYGANDAVLDENAHLAPGAPWTTSPVVGGSSPVLVRIQCLGGFQMGYTGTLKFP